MPQDPLRRGAAHLPRPLRIVVSLLTIGLGLVLITRPLASLAALTVYLAATAIAVGAGELTDDDRDRPQTLVGGLWVLLGVVVLVRPALVVSVLPWLLAALLVAGGLIRLARVRSGSVDARLSALLLGLAEIVVGVVAVAWVDITLLLVSALFGAAAIIIGARLLVGAIWPRDREADAHDHRPGAIRRWTKVLASAAALVIALGALTITGNLRQGRPSVDAFYDAPAQVPDTPGALVRSESYENSEVPSGAHSPT